MNSKLVIIGNGFDLACDLESGFGSFFSYMNNRIDLLNKKELEGQGRHSKYYDMIKTIDLYATSTETTQLANGGYTTVERVDFNYNVRRAIETVDNFFDNKPIKTEDDLNFWNLFFMLNERECNKALGKGIKNWSDVEAVIKDFIFPYDYDENSNEKKEKKSSCCFINMQDYFDSYNDWIKEYLRMADEGFGASRKSYDTRKANYSHLLGFIHATWIYKARYALTNFNHEFIYEDEDQQYRILNRELIRFENQFNDYLIKVVNKNKSQYESTALRLMKEITEDAKTYGWRLDLLSFNYTHPGSLNDYVDSYTNIHGSLLHDDYGRKGEIIFGVDGMNLDPDKVNPVSLQFTKTFRVAFNNKNSEANGVIQASSPPEEIYFYGHSLADADYSYFQSIFDTFNLYASKLNLIICYGIPPTYKHNEELYETELLESVSKLLRAYGKTLDNKDHGKNLFHKLILEGRIKLKKIDSI
ncbi:hypothetical protein M2475_002148 [Breznakia sp. PF5-3]|uniref:AbiH family protein n=1 Tax=unclassified Breznakia TaxID=2623764 RepID=UPI002405FA21|nr:MULTISPECIES: AbiH family protein [unclassified Breznakia]MDF9825742.1 hypothetical protein [Breznakia sp. PM6-1]MDF9836567.1 hypothetical protein [Breznakia sp. PF5-3]MDF9838785.1 hypothetical protein [Breznakia sp. PFB2-8]MDF9860801.1 hypothetical protein [Breznakia sp. PH5-24]